MIKLNKFKYYLIKSGRETSSRTPQQPIRLGANARTIRRKYEIIESIFLRGKNEFDNFFI